MGPGKRKQIDPLERAIETTLCPGSFIPYSAAWSFVDDLQDVANSIDEIIQKEPERAANLFETFIAACHEKADEIDDSSGSFAILIEYLFCDWINARQTANGDPDETARRLVSWMEDDPYGFCHDLDREVVKVLNKKGLDAFIQQVRSRFESSPTVDETEKRSHEYARRRWGEALKTLLAAQRNVDAYITLCEQTELEPKDCKAIAEICRRRRRPEDALSWVERGLIIGRTDGRTSREEFELGELKRALLSKIGRPQDALQLA